MVATLGEQRQRSGNHPLNKRFAPRLRGLLGGIVAQSGIPIPLRAGVVKRCTALNGPSFRTNDGTRRALPRTLRAMRSLPLFVALTLLAACGGETPPANTAPSPPVASTPAVASSAPPLATAEAPPTPPPPATTASAPTPPPPRVPALSETVGAVSKLELQKLEPQKPPKKMLELTKAADVDAALKAIGMDQSPTGALRRCPDEFVLLMKDKDGQTKGSVGLCTAETLGPEFFATGVDRKGITLSDEAALRKLLKIPAPKH